MNNLENNYNKRGGMSIEELNALGLELSGAKISLVNVGNINLQEMFNNVDRLKIQRIETKLLEIGRNPKSIA